MFGKKKKLTEQPLGYWEKWSCFQVVPDEPSRKWTSDDFIAAVGKVNGAKVNFTKYSDKEDATLVNFTYDGNDYEAVFTQRGFELPQAYLYTMRTFSRDEAEKLVNAEYSLNIQMLLPGEPQKAYHLQLKLALALAPEPLGLVDESAETAFPPRWLKLAATTEIVPPLTDLFVIQAVSGKDNSIWLHTHGLCRFGVTELEILDSDKENAYAHRGLLSAYACMLLEKDKDYDPYKSAEFIGVLESQAPVVVTCRSWTDALGEYKNLTLGGEDDRLDGHNSKTSPIFLYDSEEDMHLGKLTKLREYNGLFGGSPIFFISSKETERMQALARERFDYVKKAFADKNSKIIIKIGLKRDDGKDDYDKEHVWFELVGINGDKFTARLTHEPFAVSDLHTGDEREFTVNDITDWSIMTKEYQVSPNEVYLLEAGD